MDSYQLNKIAGAVLGTLFVILSLSFLSDAIFTSHAPETAGFAIEVEGDDGGHGEKKEAKGPTIEPIAAMLASVDVAAGQKVAKKCAACHTFDKGGKKKVGPNLYNIVGKDIASTDGFSYSSSMKEFGDGKKWTYAELNHFLYKPKAYIKGTAMGFAGMKKTPARAALIGFLRSLADTPAALPAE